VQQGFFNYIHSKRGSFVALLKGYGGNITAYHWYVDDVEVGTGSTLSHVFTLEKTETSRIVYLKLKVQDDEGDTGEYGFEVAVLRKPQNNYYIKDHLGNIRVTVDEDGNVVGSQDYPEGTPSGLSFWLQMKSVMDFIPTVARMATFPSGWPGAAAITPTHPMFTNTVASR